MYLYTGAPKTFLQYKDGTTGNTLSCEPGNVYHIVPTLPELPAVPYGFAANFALVTGEPDADREPAPEPEAAPTQDDHDLARMDGESGVAHTETAGE
jgi:hypothetical protein